MAVSRLYLDNMQTYETSDLPEADQVIDMQFSLQVSQYFFFTYE
jgi:hypothetical protein